MIKLENVTKIYKGEMVALRDASVDIDKGEKVRFGRITVIGNTRTRDKVIRRELRVYEGEFYSSSALERSKMLVTRLGFFETVDIQTTRGDTEDTMNVVVEVKEKPTGTFQIGAGFSSIESFVAQAQIAQNNLFGRGQNLSLQATLSRIRTIANLRFADIPSPARFDDREVLPQRAKRQRPRHLAIQP